MLGIRKHNDCAIDLWQGDLRNFVCDAAVVFYAEGTPKPGFAAGLPSGEAMVVPGHQLGYPTPYFIAASYPSILDMDDRSNLGAVLNSFTNALRLVGELGIRHVSMQAPQSVSLGDLYGSLAMVAIKSFIDEVTTSRQAGVKCSCPARWTLVLDQLETYDCFQAQLFAAFPDTP